MTTSSRTRDGTRPADADPAATGNRLRGLFERALEVAAAEREDWIAAHVAGADERAALRRLLAADRTSGFLDTPATEHARRFSAEEVSAGGLIGQRIGAFRVVRALGQGGMAAVFLGERVDADFEQQVAIKLLRRGLYSELEQRLFQRERQVLAALDHPAIARLIDGGVTDAGIPYLVMEHVDGVPITRYAADHALDVAGRVRLFLAVCRAVEAAHRNLIVHRDIKPSNVLVNTRGEVKLLDFGIAKLIEEEDDAAGATVGVYTPDYAAPEQVAGAAITTATDVYGLGVLLHELLLGVRPDGSPTRRPSSRVTELDAFAPATDGSPGAAKARDGRERSQLRKLLRGDLDNILLKALAPEPERRYASAGALADDIERYLERRPVAAHPPSRLYRTRKFIQRHRGGVALTTLLVLGIAAALALALWQGSVARAQAARANTVRDFLVDVFDAARAHLPRDQRLTPEALVDQAQRRLAATPGLDAATRSDLLRTLGEVNLSLSDFGRAETLFAQAQALADADAAPATRVLHADALQRAGRNAEALRELAPQLDALRARPSAALLRALAVQSAAEMATGAVEPALAHRREAAAAAQALYGADTPDALAVAFEVGNTLADAQRYPEARSVLAPLIERWRAIHAAEDDHYVAALTSLATASDAVGDQPGSEARYRELLALQQRIYRAPHEVIARTMRDLALIVVRAEKFPEAESLLQQALAMQRAIYGDGRGDAHAQIAETDDALGEVYVAQRRFADADAAYRAAIEVCARAQIREEVCPRARNNLGMSLYRQGRLDEAKAEMTRALDERRALFGADHPTVAFSLSTLANVAVKQDKPDEAVRLSAEALAVLDRAGRASSREAALIRNGYAQALWLAQRNDDALREIERTLADWQRLEPNGKARRVVMLVQKAQILRDLKRPDAARAAANEAIALDPPPGELAASTKQLLRELSGRADAFPDPPAGK